MKSSLNRQLSHSRRGQAGVSLFQCGTRVTWQTRSFFLRRKLNEVRPSTRRGLPFRARKMLWDSQLPRRDSTNGRRQCISGCRGEIVQELARMSHFVRWIAITRSRMQIRPHGSKCEANRSCATVQIERELKRRKNGMTIISRRDCFGWIGRFKCCLHRDSSQ